MKILLLLAIFLSGCLFSEVSHHKKERDYQNEWCARYGGRVEVVMKDRTRCDCLTSKYAIEFDFASKWAEAIGQSLHYARLTGKRPGIVLICRKDSDSLKLKILKENIRFYNLDVTVWNINC